MKRIRVGRKGRGYFALVDNEDFELVSQYSWQVHKGYKTVYACTYVKGLYLTMHRLILGLTDEKILTDHINHDGLDNRKCNLRKCTYGQNRLNGRSFKIPKSGYRGVYIKDHKFIARMTINKEVTHIGSFNTAIEAAIAYNKKAFEVDPEFCTLNNV